MGGEDNHPRTAFCLLHRLEHFWPCIPQLLRRDLPRVDRNRGYAGRCRNSRRCRAARRER